MEDLAKAMKDMGETLGASIGAIKSLVDESQSILREIGNWKPQVDIALQDLRSDVNTLRQQLGRVALNPILELDPSTLQARAARPAMLDGGGAVPVIGDGGRGQFGHGVLHANRGQSDGALALPTPPAKGTLVDLDPHESSFLHRGASWSGGNRAPRPKLDFSSFTGERPKSWHRQCESYFRVFEIQPECWVDTATMHFVGAASMLLENCGMSVESLDWESLCALICNQFGRDEFQRLLRQLFSMKQTGSVVEYIQEFIEVMHALKAHTSAWDPELFPARFVDGLKDEIRVVVLVH
uniref:Uncharacterized protein n=1 Tax=Avena sativa TaxID=4498 RepID=A0ACD5YU76_AVESA